MNEKIPDEAHFSLHLIVQRHGLRQIADDLCAVRFFNMHNENDPGKYSEKRYSI